MSLGVPSCPPAQYVVLQCQSPHRIILPSPHRVILPEALCAPVWLQALHAICLAHFERDQAAGGSLYANFARCYLQLAGAQPGTQPGQHKNKAQQLQGETAADSDQVSYM